MKQKGSTIVGKYTPPAVTLRDVLAALPPLPLPLGWRVGFLPQAGNTTSAHCTVELVYTTSTAAQYVWRRWGKSCSNTSATAPFSTLLHAAHEAAWYVEGIDVETLRKRVSWDLGVL